VLRQQEWSTKLQGRVEETGTLLGKLDQSGADLRRQIDEVRSDLRRRLISDENVTNQISELRSELGHLKADLEKVVPSDAEGRLRKAPSIK
jgi:hypothetical protein